MTHGLVAAHTELVGMPAPRVRVNHEFNPHPSPRVQGKLQERKQALRENDDEGELEVVARE